MCEKCNSHDHAAEQCGGDKTPAASAGYAHSMYPCQWRGDDPRGLSAGVAMFMVEGEKYEFRLESFNDLQRVAIMLEAANQQGKEFGAYAVYDTVVNAATRRAKELGMDHFLRA